MMESERTVREAVRPIIEGRQVKRIRHELSFDGKDPTGIFIEELTGLGYHPTTVGEVQVEPGEWVPAFYLDSGVAYFG